MLAGATHTPPHTPIYVCTLVKVMYASAFPWDELCSILTKVLNFPADNLAIYLNIMSILNYMFADSVW